MVFAIILDCKLTALSWSREKRDPSNAISCLVLGSVFCFKFLRMIKKIQRKAKFSKELDFCWNLVAGWSFSSQALSLSLLIVILQCCATAAIHKGLVTQFAHFWQNVNNMSVLKINNSEKRTLRAIPDAHSSRQAHCYSSVSDLREV